MWLTPVHYKILFSNPLNKQRLPHFCCWLVKACFVYLFIYFFYGCQMWLKLNNPSRDSDQAWRLNKFTDQCFVVNLLPDELVFAEGVAGFSCDGIYGSLLHLLLYGTVKHEQRLPGTFLVKERHKERSYRFNRFSFLRLFQNNYHQNKGIISHLILVLALWLGKTD